MPPENCRPGSPEDWLRYARSDLELARVEQSPYILLESLCFHAQQAAEKAIKAVLLANNIPFPRTHHIGTLLDLLPQNIAPPHEIQDSAILTDYAVISRYPEDVEPVMEEEYEEAVRLAEIVIKWADEIIRR